MGSKLFYTSKINNTIHNKSAIKVIKIVIIKSHLMTSLIVLARM